MSIDVPVILQDGVRERQPFEQHERDRESVASGHLRIEQDGMKARVKSLNVKEEQKGPGQDKKTYGRTPNGTGMAVVSTRNLV